jgi:NAD(P)-dependent dehydrogenase (short-subunit alcohol dehydrogenase family)
MEGKPAVAILGGSGGLGEAVCLRVAKDAKITIGYNKGLEKAQKLADAIKSSGSIPFSSF